jgi:hypothetical protein
MKFLYQGFTHQGHIRSFTFHGMEQSKVTAIFSLEVDLVLFAKNQVAIQAGPMFCLQLLNTACEADPDFVARLHSYRIVQEDLRELVNDREQRAASKACRVAPRRPPRKPPINSQLRGLGAPKDLSSPASASTHIEVGETRLQ